MKTIARVAIPSSMDNADELIQLLRSNRLDPTPYSDAIPACDVAVRHVPAISDAALSTLRGGATPTMLAVDRLTRKDRDALIQHGIEEVIEVGAHPVEWLARIRSIFLRKRAPRVLLVEDDSVISDHIRSALNEIHHECTISGNLYSANLAIRSEIVDVIILDRMLPDGDGLDFLAALRSANVRMPVIVLSNLHELGDRLQGYDAEADDYQGKPFEIEDLLARVQIQLRPRSRGDRFSVGVLELNRREKVAFWRGERLPLGPQLVELLAFFLERSGISVPTSMLLADVWRVHAGEANTVNQSIGRLRGTLEEVGIVDALVTERNPSRLSRTPTTYRLELDPIIKASGLVLDQKQDV